MSKQIDVDTLRQWLDERRPVTVLDIRTDEDRSQWAIPGSVHLNVYKDLRAGKYGEWGRTVPILFVTGWADFVSGAIANGVGPKPLAILPKPADSDRMDALIGELLNKR